MEREKGWLERIKKSVIPAEAGIIRYLSFVKKEDSQIPKAHEATKRLEKVKNQPLVF